MREKLLAKNTIASIISQITTLLSGFILPRFFLQRYGSEVNGLVNSITQFLSLIAFLEFGVGAVVQSALYKPLADKDNESISKVLVSANNFFRKLAQILLIYVVVLIVVYPRIDNQNFGYLYTATIIIAISISSFFQYYFGIVNSLLLNADQRGYIQYNAQTVTTILNTIVCVTMIEIGGSVQLVKLVSSLIYLTRPVVLNLYVKRNYKIDWKISYKDEPIKQKWNGVAQHIAAVVLDGTDTIVLTLFSTLSNVSIYSIYFMVVKGVKNLFLSTTNGIQALLGELWAKKEICRLNIFFGFVEWGIHTGTIFVFSCTAALIVNFVQVYTLGIYDANYIQPLFAILLTAANALHCLRLPYNIMILAAGHYKQTQSNYIIAALINIFVSVLFVKKFGLIGVAIGTLVAVSFQTIWLAIYNSMNIICWPIKKVVKQFLVDGLTSFLIYKTALIFSLGDVTYICWLYLALKVSCVAIIITLIVNVLFYREMIVLLLKKIKKVL